MADFRIVATLYFYPLYECRDMWRPRNNGNIANRRDGHASISPGRLLRRWQLIYKIIQTI